jgi:asparagine synthase (glutamine-hydrolysing)
MIGRLGDWTAAGVALARTYGLFGLAARSRHELRRALGTFQTSPRMAVEAFATAEDSWARAFAVDRERLRSIVNDAGALDQAEHVATGSHEAFGWEWRPLPTDAASWLGTTPDQHSAPATVPWWKVDTLSSEHGDLRTLWEPARFGWVYDLVRGHLLTGEDRFADAFMWHFRSWRESSPPFRGPHWACGQESAIRAIALLYAEANLGENLDPATIRDLRATLAATGERIADAIGYARSQRNNHALSEATGLIAIGARFGYERWQRLGRRVLEASIRDQFAEDGWYAQHSLNYARVALDQCVVAQRVLQLSGQSLSVQAVGRLEAAFDLLCLLVSPETGSVPNYGPSDSSSVHPVASTPTSDHRPLLTALSVTFGFSLPADLTADREAEAWLGRDADRGPPLGDFVRSGASGWAVVRQGDTDLFLRAGAYRNRPGHSDALQLCVRMAGRPILVDPGTYGYNAPEDWTHMLRTARVHNGPLLDDADPAVAGPRFLWLRWPEARLEAVHEIGAAVVIEASRPKAVRRTVRVRPGRVEVEDEGLAPDAQELIVRWLLHPAANPDELLVSGRTRLIEAASEREDALGWYAPAYGFKTPSRTLEARIRSGAWPLRIRTVLDSAAATTRRETEETLDAATAS